ncbi:hypothetical protein ACYATP_02600 [Lactobacillaceae bacterium Melli_B4]
MPLFSIGAKDKIVKNKIEEYNANNEYKKFKVINEMLSTSYAVINDCIWTITIKFNKEHIDPKIDVEYIDDIILNCFPSGTEMIQPRRKAYSKKHDMYFDIVFQDLDNECIITIAEDR